MDVNHETIDVASEIALADASESFQENDDQEDNYVPEDSSEISDRNITGQPDPSESFHENDEHEVFEENDVPEDSSEHAESNITDEPDNEDIEDHPDLVDDSISEHGDLEDANIKELAREWMMLQIGNNCSNQVADNFFRFAMQNSHVFQRLKEEHGKEPSLKHLRKKIVKEDIPGILQDFRYWDLSLPEEEREANEIFVQNVESQPTKRYPPDRYELVGQVTKVDVSFDIYFFLK